MIHISAWIYIVLFSLSAVLSIFSIGKPRNALTHGGAVFVLFSTGGLVYLLLTITKG